MVHNMEPMVIPFGGNPWMEGLKNILRRYAAKRACTRATRIIAVSGFVRDYLVQRWRIDASKVCMVPHGTQQPDPRLAVKPTALVGDEPPPFVFSAGTIRPYRGIEDIIAALSAPSLQGIQCRLLVAGGTTRGLRSYGARLRRLAARRGVAARITWAGEFPPAQMAWCFEHCAAFVMTSRVEACPITALEALSHGCMIVSTRLPPMPEFFGDAALYYTAADGADLARQLTTVLDRSPEQRASLRVAAQRRASQFSWQETVRKTIEQLQLAAATAR
jgi:glycosyltransferase involved in cell wall biosynthesis